MEQTCNNYATKSYKTILSTTKIAHKRRSKLPTSQKILVYKTIIRPICTEWSPAVAYTKHSHTIHINAIQITLFRRLKKIIISFTSNHTQTIFCVWETQRIVFRDNVPFTSQNINTHPLDNDLNSRSVDDTPLYL